MKLKRNKFLIFSFVIVLFIMGMYLFQYYNDYFDYKRGYYSIRENCYEKKNPNHEVCERFKTEAQIKSYIKYAVVPEESLRQMDAITLTSETVESTTVSSLQWFSPLLIIIAVIGTVHTEFSSGMFKNYLTRMKYKDYLKKTYKVAIKSALIVPVALIILFITCSFLTGFNFNIIESTKYIATYDEWKYNNFLLYWLCICTIQFIISLLYANIGLFFCKKNKNKIVAIIMAYVGFIVVNLFIYAVLYVIIINKILGFKELTDYFFISGYWFFDKPKSCYIAILLSLLFTTVSLIVLYLSFKNKEKVVQANENQVA